MKIILKAFDKLSSEVMDVPEETGLTFKLELKQRPQIAFAELDIRAMPPLRKIATFEYSGYSSFIEGENHEVYKIYKLVDIN